MCLCSSASLPATCVVAAFFAARSFVCRTDLSLLFVRCRWRVPSMPLCVLFCLNPSWFELPLVSSRFPAALSAHITQTVSIQCVYHAMKTCIRIPSGNTRCCMSMMCIRHVHDRPLAMIVPHTASSGFQQLRTIYLIMHIWTLFNAYGIFLMN